MEEIKTAVQGMNSKAAVGAYGLDIPLSKELLKVDAIAVLI